MSRKNDMVMLKKILDEISSRRDFIMVDKYADVLSRIQSVIVITNKKSFTGITDNNWYIGTTEYIHLLDAHIFKYLRNLRCLRLHYNITEHNLFDKLGLEEDDIWFNRYKLDQKIKRLPDEIGELAELVTLDISFTSIKEVPDSVSNLSKLEYLFLDNTLIEEIPFWVGNLNKLQIINLSNLVIRYLPKSLIDLKLPFLADYRYDSWEKGIYISNTVLMIQPISLFYQNRKLIENYYDSERIELHESKVIFMGDGGAGKSCTIKRILNGGKPLVKDTDVTHDITIDCWDDKEQVVGYDGTIYFWDFGGQDIYLSMHRCFLTERSCYVVLLSNRQYGSHRGLIRQARYWLKNIAAFCQKSPILIAINTWSGQPRDGISLTQLRREFPELNIVDQIVYDAHDNNEEFNRLTARICQMAKDNYSYDLQFPIAWNNIRNRLHQDYNNDNLISETEYYRICEQEMKRDYDKGIATWLLSWFNDLGDCFNYHDIFENRQDEEYYVLRPQWVIKAMYKIINFSINLNADVKESPNTDDLSKELSENSIFSDGKIPKKVFIKVLEKDKEYKGKAEYIIHILEKNGLTYSLVNDKNERLFIPSICTDIRPDDFDEPDYDFNTTTMYLVRFTYLPETVIHRLMIRCFQNNRELEKVWKYGFWIKDDEECLVVELIDDTELKITCYRKNENYACSGLHMMRTWLGEIYKDLGIENTKDYIIEKTPLQKAYISVTALIYARLANPELELFYAQDDDIYVGHQVDGLLKGLYGSNYKKLIEEEREKYSEYDARRGTMTESLSKRLSFFYIAKIIQKRFRTQFTDPPSNEKEVQERLQKFFDAQGYKQGNDYERESGKFLFAGKEYIPDFVFNKSNTVIEVKFLNERAKKSKIIMEMNDDYSAYTKVYKSIIYLVYDICVIRNVDEFIGDFEAKGNVRVIVIKH